MHRRLRKISIRAMTSTFLYISNSYTSIYTWEVLILAN